MMKNFWQGKRVLVVDDSYLAREQVASIFTESGLTVVGKVSNGLDALKGLDEFKPDLISLDIIMPEMDGIECYRFLAKNRSDIKLLIVSSLSSEPRVIQSYLNEIASSSFLEKPLNIERLKLALSKIFEGESTFSSPTTP